MVPFIRKLYVKTVRKILVYPSVRSLITKMVPKLFAFSENQYVKYKDIECNYLDTLCDPKKAALDIGVLWGGYTYSLQKYCSSVYCFEPNYYNYSFLKRAFRKSGQIFVNNYAISNSSGKAKFRIPQNNPGNATMEELNDLAVFNDIAEIEVTKTSIDKLAIENIGFIKIDIEGHELAALEGMKNTLLAQRPNLLVEIEERHNKGSIGKAENFMRDLNYCMLYIKNNTLLDIKNFDSKKDQDPNIRNTSNYINNFIFIPSERKEAYFKLIKNHGLNIGID